MIISPPGPVTRPSSQTISPLKVANSIICAREKDTVLEKPLACKSATAGRITFLHFACHNLTSSGTCRGRTCGTGTALPGLCGKRGQEMGRTQLWRPDTGAGHLATHRVFFSPPLILVGNLSVFSERVTHR